MLPRLRSYLEHVGPPTTAGLQAFDATMIFAWSLDSIEPGALHGQSRHKDRIVKDSA